MSQTAASRSSTDSSTPKAALRVVSEACSAASTAIVCCSSLRQIASFSAHAFVLHFHSEYSAQLQACMRWL